MHHAVRITCRSVIRRLKGIVSGAFGRSTGVGARCAVTVKKQEEIMAISIRGERLKREMAEAVTLRRESDALEREWRELLEALEELPDEDLGVAQAVNRERMAVRRALTQRQLTNWARITAGDLTPLQRRILGLRYVRGCSWGDIIAQLKKARQYLHREHNKALDKLAEHAFETDEKIS